MCRNDILRKQGIIPEKPPSPTPMIEEALQEARRLAHENRLEGKDLDELAELEDEEDEDFLNQYRSAERRCSLRGAIGIDETQTEEDGRNVRHDPRIRV